MKTLQDSFILKNGVKIPCVGFGTWQTPDGETAVMAVSEAIKTGYRHIDTAACYGNEVGVGQGIKASGIEREKLFVTSKVWNTERGYEKTIAAFEKTLSDLGLDYLDLYLIHWPASSSQYDNWEEINVETWRAMTELYKAGRIKAIGVSNFLPHHLEALMKTEVPPMVNQIEFHPGQMQTETIQYCRENDILVEAWSPLGTGRMLNNETLKSIVDKYEKSVAQLCIRWCLQNNILPLPKSVTPARIKENTAVFDFAITEKDMDTINAMAYCGGSGLHPDQVDF
ncbi:aldo/keto reductase [Lactonifactor sp. BIOML-A3]|uniref:aldo/keto reductase n=1 Tax=unclassified Lactonifactor TaxID=2636670 RepID=UPI0012B1534E|nr:MULTISPECIES: aldo/keto reductase [unclassified Lactonifactor]MSA02022.1 aldo/keto reductase [Lactonifactor sp. BIOML-A5]MSA08536.1 aldo/keto reductase [Lactonifactor sp. BIOML-A4]MSA12895.1 aldo/keto reductase [Lactonifactor sp. BIOML-A3]MSA17603.1 aldo/keto reductase [Lactonifactor sp. BIOML-A2]MSA37135.1 aldo/keto reductase [Lactonifactor sp. BIOML-A1]